jgi:hypothetical protein
MTDNFNTISSYFDSLDNGQFLLIEIRTKENSKWYQVYSKEELDSIKTEIIAICKALSGKAYFWVNSRETKLFQARLIQDIAKSMERDIYWIPVEERALLSSVKDFKYKVLHFKTHEWSTINKYLDVFEYASKKELNYKSISNDEGVDIIVDYFKYPVSDKFTQECIIRKLPYINISDENILIYSE